MMETVCEMEEDGCLRRIRLLNADNRKQVIGYAIIESDFIKLIFIDILYRNQDYGSKLMERVKQDIQERGHSVCVLNATTSINFENMPTDAIIQFCEKNGFEHPAPCGWMSAPEWLKRWWNTENIMICNL